MNMPYAQATITTGEDAWASVHALSGTISTPMAAIPSRLSNCRACESAARVIAAAGPLARRNVGRRDDARCGNDGAARDTRREPERKASHSKKRGIRRPLLDRTGQVGPICPAHKRSSAASNRKRKDPHSHPGAAACTPFAALKASRKPLHPAPETANAAPAHSKISNARTPMLQAARLGPRFAKAKRA